MRRSARLAAAARGQDASGPALVSDRAKSGGASASGVSRPVGPGRGSPQARRFEGQIGPQLAAGCRLAPSSAQGAPPPCLPAPLHGGGRTPRAVAAVGLAFSHRGLRAAL